MENNLTWSFYQIWNKSLEEVRERPPQPREKIWASELGGAMIDRWLKLKGEPPTNPPNPRSRRKFEAGNMMEWIVGLVLKRAGIFIARNQWLEFKYANLLPVTGKLDFIAGGKPDWEKAQKEIQELDLPPFFYKASNAIIAYLREKYPEGLNEIILEVKSCSSRMFEKYEQFGIEASKHHAMQLFHYLLTLKKREGHLTYISKDDLRMLELGVWNPSYVQEWYIEDIKTLSEYYYSDTQPPKERIIIFDEDSYKFALNWKVTYSTYLTKLYRFKSQHELEIYSKKRIGRWNRTFARCVNGKKLTDLNLKVIQKIKKDFPNFDELVEKAKEKKIVLNEENL
jgi:hypothetical protein